MAPRLCSETRTSHGGTICRGLEGMPLPPNTLAALQRQMVRLGFIQIREIEEARQKRLEQQHETGPHAMVRLLARIVGVGVETADMLVHEVLSRPMRDRRAVARYAGPTGSPDESGAQRQTRAGPSRQRPGPPRHDPTRLALSAVSTGQRPGSVVPGSHGRSPWRHAQNDDRRTGAQTANHTLALCHDGRDTGGRRLTSSGVKGFTGTSINGTSINN